MRGTNDGLTEINCPVRLGELEILAMFSYKSVRGADGMCVVAT